jgi:hypothetical protein
VHSLHGDASVVSLWSENHNETTQTKKKSKRGARSG